MKKSLIRSIKLFALFSHLSLKSHLQGRLGILFFLIGKIIRFLLFLSLIIFIVSKTKLIKGYTTNQAVIFFLTFNIIDTASQLLFREVYRFRPLVISGNLDHILLKPYHPFLRVLLGGIDFLDMLMLIPYLIFNLFLIFTSLTPSLFNLFLYFILILNGILIATGFHILVLAIGLMTTEVDHTIMIYRDFTSLARFPIEIYREPIRTIFTFIVPIAVMMNFPVKGLLGIINPLLILFSLLTALFINLISNYLWRLSLKKYQSWGG